MVPKVVVRFIFAAAVCLLFAVGVAAQVTPSGRLSGTVTDPTPAALVGAQIHLVDDATGETFDTTTSEGGTFTIASLHPGTYTVTVAKEGFKKGIYKGVKIIVGETYVLTAKLELGAVTATVVVEAGQEVIETASATVGASITGMSITSLPFSSRDVNDLALLMPGAQTVGRPRASSFVGLPKGAINMTYDGINVQDNVLKSNDGFYTYIRPRIDNVEEFSISTAAQGAEQAGEGAVQIRMISKRGGNAFHGGAWEYLRNDWFNANYFFNTPGFNNQPRQVQRLNEYGYKIGGPILKDKLFFFTDFDFYSNPQSLTRSRYVPSVAATQGFFTYSVGSVPTIPAGNTWTTCNAAALTCTVNVLQLAAASGGPSTVDAQVASVLTAINGAATAPGVSVSTTDPSLYQKQLNFTNMSHSARKFPDVRFDWNISKNHSFEFDYHYAHFMSDPDFLNSKDPTYPVAPFNAEHGLQASNRNLFVGAWRWSIGNNKTNELRFGVQSGLTAFYPDLSTSAYLHASTNLGSVLIRPSFPTNMFNGQPFTTYSTQGRNTPLGQLIENFSWTKSTHTLSFGLSWTQLRFHDFFYSPRVATVTFGLDANADPLSAAFSNSGATPSVPGAASADLTVARSLYAMLAGRINNYSGSVYLDPTQRQFVTGAPQLDKFHQREFGFYFTDSWRVRPSLTATYGLRWEYQGAPADDLNEYFSLQGGFAAVYGRSGLNHLFQPGTLSGAIPVYTLNGGKPWYNTDMRDFAPSVGLAWQPNSEQSFLKKMLGGAGKTVVRLGYSISYTREGLNNFSAIAGSNPGYSGSQVASPVSSCTGTCGAGTFVPGTYTLAGLNYQTNKQSPASFVPTFQIDPVASQAINVFDANLKVPRVQSWSVGVQREITANTVVEVRYVGNHGTGLWHQDNLNEVNIFENGFLQEFKYALNNLTICRANFVAGTGGNPPTGACATAQANAGVTQASRSGSSFANWGLACGQAGVICPAGFSSTANQSPLPIMTAAFTGSNGSQANTSFASGTYVQYLDTGLAGSFANSLATSLSVACRMFGSTVILPLSTTACPSNTTTSTVPSVGAYPPNFFMVNPDAAPGGAYRMVNIGQSTYNGLQVEFRRRESKGLQFNANYTFSKSLTNYFADSSSSYATFDTLRTPGRNKGPAPFDLRHAFKLQLIYTLPFGPGRKWSSSHALVNRLIEGWELNTITRWQSGRVTQLQGGLGGTVNQNDGGVVLTGLTGNQLQSQLAINKSVAGNVFWVPASLLDAKKQKANTAFLAACATAGAFCARDFITGPQFIRADWSLAKHTKITERVDAEIRAEFLNLFNYPNFFYQGSAATSVSTVSLQSNTFGRITDAYQDTSTTDDFGGRILQMVFRITF